MILVPEQLMHNSEVSSPLPHLILLCEGNKNIRSSKQPLVYHTTPAAYLLLLAFVLGPY